MSEWFGTASARLTEWDRHADYSPSLIHDWCSNRFNSLLAEVWQWPAEVSDECCDPTTQEIEVCFKKFADEWSRDVQNVSSLTDMVLHPRYRQIINMKWDVVPFLLIDMQHNKRYWLPALTEITGIQPFDPKDAGNNKRMIEAWIKWGKHKYPDLIN